MSHREAKPGRRQIDRAIVEQEIVACDGDLIALEKAVVDMKAKRLALNTKLNSTSHFLSMLPLDTISEIFCLINESQERKDFCQLPPPFLLGRVCKAWRGIVLSRPRLWSIIVIRLSLKPKRLEAQRELLQQWLKNSEPHVLCYYIEYDSFELPPSIAEVIIDTSPRWKSLKCDSLFPQLLRSFQTPDSENPRPFPHLTSLDLSLDLTHNNGERYSFGSTPQLRHLAVSGATTRNLHLSWEQLSTLTASVDVDTALKMIKLLDGIQQLYFDMSYALRDCSAISAVPRTLPSLVSLKISGNSFFIKSILCSVSTPSLINLSLYDWSNDREAAWNSEVLALYRRASFPLKALKLKNVDISEAYLVALLRRFNDLSSLFIDGFHDRLSDIMIKELDPTTFDGLPQPISLPALRYFSYYGGKIDFQAATMTRMMKQRLLYSQKNLGENKVEALRSLDIKYTNMNWSREGDRADPNRLQDFYRDLVDLSARGSTLKLVWERQAPTSGIRR